jgi:anti-anti-sigma regulatory factor
MSELKNYREVGIFDLLSAPLNPIGAFDAEQFKNDAESLLKRKSTFIAVDLTGLDFLYSDAYNAFTQLQKELSLKKGSVGILTNNKTIIDGMHRVGLDHSVLIFRAEADMMGYSIKEEEKEEKAKQKETVKDSEDQRKTGDVEEAEEDTDTTAHSGNADISTVNNATVPPHRRGRFTVSFNAIKDEDKENSGKAKSPFDEDGKASRLGLWVLLGCICGGGAIAFLILRSHF